MGIGFVLFGLGFLLILIGAPVACILLGRAHYTGGAIRFKRVGLWMVLAVPLAASYALLGFSTYAAWCYFVRSVDPGIGDGFMVPAGHGYVLDCIDTTEQGSIRRDSLDSQPTVWNVTHIGEEGHYVFGATGPRYFLLNTQDGKLDQDLQRSDFEAKLSSAGITHNQLVSVDAFYTAKRWRWPDLIAVALLGFPPALLACFGFKKAWA